MRSPTIGMSRCACSVSPPAWRASLHFQPRTTRPDGAGHDPSGPDHWRGPGVAVGVSVRARGLAGTAGGILTSFFINPKEDAKLKAMAVEMGQMWLLMGVSYRSDIDAESALKGLEG